MYFKKWINLETYNLTSLAVLFFLCRTEKEEKMAEAGGGGAGRSDKSTDKAERIMVKNVSGEHTEF